MPGRRSVFIHSREIEDYSYPPDSPFKTQRAGRVRQILYMMGLLSGDGISEVAPVPADRRILKKLQQKLFPKLSPKQCLRMFEKE